MSMKELSNSLHSTDYNVRGLNNLSQIPQKSNTLLYYCWKLWKHVHCNERHRAKIESNY